MPLTLRQGGLRVSTTDCPPCWICAVHALPHESLNMSHALPILSTLFLVCGMYLRACGHAHSGMHSFLSHSHLRTHRRSCMP
jgi:hypothetical protein